MTSEKPISYSSTGINYDSMDPFKRMAQSAARETSGNIERTGYSVVERSRGESAIVIDHNSHYSAHVIEGLGTKNLVADAVRPIRIGNQSLIASEMDQVTGRTYYDAIAQDALAMIINDLITVGADPILVNQYLAAGNSEWFEDSRRVEDLIQGWKSACDISGSVWGGGETPTLPGIIYSETIDLGGSCFGEIKPKSRLTLGDNLTEGDRILLVESSGIHSNGLTLARRIAANIATEQEMPLSEAYSTELSDGSMYGEALLIPTHIYSGLTRELFEAGIDIHYMANITGHGWRKLMRYADRDFTYRMHTIPRPHPVFGFIENQSHNDKREMYGNFNMGAGFALFVPQEHVEGIQEIAHTNHNLDVLNAGVVEKGERKVVIEPLELTFESGTLGVR